MNEEYWLCTNCEYGISGPAFSVKVTTAINKHENETGHTMKEIPSAG